MTDQERKAMEMALHGLLDAREVMIVVINDQNAYQDEIKALRQALAQPEQEPWVPLTIEEIKEMLYGLHGDYRTPMLTLVNVVEAKLKEKNGGSI